MATVPPVKEVSLELVRELLIAISHSTPEKLVTSESFFEDSKGLNGTVVKNADNPEELRSELISISSVPSPDEISPLFMGALEA